jgi:hypothetical protein
MFGHAALPRARQDGLLEEAVGEELLLYDQDCGTAHCLSPIAACVWRHCDGEHNVAQLAEFAGVNEDLVVAALQELREKSLLIAEPELMQDTVSGESRREVITRVARYGAAAAGASMIVSATAATPAMASSGKGCGNCKTENCCVKEMESICCCCEDGTAHTGSSTQTCTTICKDNGGSHAETKEARAV